MSYWAQPAGSHLGSLVITVKRWLELQSLKVLWSWKAKWTSLIHKPGSDVNVRGELSSGS